MLDQIMRCSDGHVYVEGVSRGLFSLHLGAGRFERCRIDKRWRFVRFVDSADLTDGELTQLNNDEKRAR